MASHRDLVTSADGTKIAVETTGEGQPVVLIGGAFTDRGTMGGLAQVLSPRYTAVTYDRRGRGDSGDVSGDYSADREIEDLRAVVDHVGGAASLFGHSSGGVLVLEAASRGVPVERIAVYETPFIPEGSRPRPAPDFGERLAGLVRAGDKDGATALFQIEGIGLPPQMVEGMRHSDMWGYLTGLAHSLPYDAALFEPDWEVPTTRLAAITVPTLTIAGSDTFPWLAGATEQVAEAVPGARFLSLAGQDHGILQSPEALQPSLQEFFG